MLGTIDLRGIQPKSVDHVALQGHLQQLVGQPFLHFRFSYGDELSLHLGQPQDYSSPKLKHFVKGSYFIGARASNWYLRPSSSPIVLIGLAEDRTSLPVGFHAVAKADLESSELIPASACVICANAVPMAAPGGAVVGYSLSLVFSDGSSILMIPDSVGEPGAQEDEIADWEVFTPHDRYLRVGPGVEWSYLPSRQSAPEQPA